MKTFKLLPLTVIIALLTSCTHASDPLMMNLAGEWVVDLPDDLPDGPIILPGTTDIAGYGTSVDTASMTRDEQFRRLTRRFSYIGPATYSRNVTISPAMAGEPLELYLERVIWKSSATIGGIKMGNEEVSLVAPHRHLLRQGLPAGEYLLEIEIDNSKQYDISTSDLAHCYTNDTQTIWNGILGTITLRALPQYNIEFIEVYPSENLDSVKITAAIDNMSDSVAPESVTFSIGKRSQSIKEKLHPGRNLVDCDIYTGDLERWNEFNPVVHTATVTIGDDVRSAEFGLRSIDNLNGIRINGVPVFLRGTLECCVFPLSGVPPTDKAGWTKTFKTAREWGLNHLRFHSWCPPEAAFTVADSMGFYLQVELPVWSLKIGDDPAAESFLRDEFEQIVTNYGNHPSLCLISVGNELQHDFNWLNETVKLMKQRDPRHLYTTTSFTFEKGHGGHPEPADQFFVTQWTDKGWVRGQGIFENESPSFNKNYAASVEGCTVPLISHEIGQYAVYPAISEIDKYTGILNPLNFKSIRSDLEEKGLIDVCGDMTAASARLAAILYKEEIERALKTPGFSGFQLLGLQDFPGQGTALVGLVDAFWDNKGAVNEEWFREFCSPVVPLLNFDKAVYSTDSIFKGDIFVANFSDKALLPDEIEWSLTIDGEDAPFSHGTLSTDTVYVGKVTGCGSFESPLTAVTRPSTVIARINLGDDITNSWKIHVYPHMDTTTPDNVVFTNHIDEALSALERGCNVIFAPASDNINGIESKFLPVFWSPVHFPKQAGTMGIMCDPSHPALDKFPNAGHTDWQWWQLCRNAKVINLDSVPGATPIISVIDNFVNNRKLSYLFEAKCNQGNLLFCSIDILNEKIDGPEWKAFIASLTQYAGSDQFAPTSEIEPSVLYNLTGHSAATQPTTATSIYE